MSEVAKKLGDIVEQSLDPANLAPDVKLLVHIISKGLSDIDTSIQMLTTTMKHEIDMQDARIATLESKCNYIALKEAETIGLLNKVNVLWASAKALLAAIAAILISAVLSNILKCVSFVTKRASRSTMLLKVISSRHSVTTKKQQTKLLTC